MKTKKLLILLTCLIFLLSFIIISSENDSTLKLSQGKNKVLLNITEPFYVDTLVKLNPDIAAVSYKQDNITIGYVNLFGGVGEKFIVNSGEYEIIMKVNSTILLPK